MNRIATAANASLISKRSMSPTSRPAFASALREAGAGLLAGGGLDHAAVQRRERAAARDHHPVARVRGARVDAEDDHQ